jgi:hypothetical protein
MTTKSRILHPELEFFEQHRQQWLTSHRDEYVVVSDTTVAGFYSGFELAFHAGV